MDNKSVLGCTKPTWNPRFSPSITTVPDWDVLDLMDQLQERLKKRIPNIAECEHVKSHQDKAKPIHELPWKARLNYLADNLATSALTKFLSTNSNSAPQWYPLPNCVAYLEMEGRIHTSKMIPTLKALCTEQPMHDYLMRRNKWNQDTLESVNWSAFRDAYRSFPKTESVFLTKLCTCWLPTARRTALYDSGDSNR